MKDYYVLQKHLEKWSKGFPLQALKKRKRIQKTWRYLNFSFLFISFFVISLLNNKYIINKLNWKVFLRVRPLVNGEESCIAHDPNGKTLKIKDIKVCPLVSFIIIITIIVIAIIIVIVIVIIIIIVSLSHHRCHRQRIVKSLPFTIRTTTIVAVSSPHTYV